MHQKNILALLAVFALNNNIQASGPPSSLCHEQLGLSKQDPSNPSALTHIDELNGLVKDQYWGNIDHNTLKGILTAQLNNKNVYDGRVDGKVKVENCLYFEYNDTSYMATYDYTTGDLFYENVHLNFAQGSNAIRVHNTFNSDSLSTYSSDEHDVKMLNQIRTFFQHTWASVLVQQRLFSSAKATNLIGSNGAAKSTLQDYIVNFLNHNPSAKKGITSIADHVFQQFTNEQMICDLKSGITALDAKISSQLTSCNGQPLGATVCEMKDDVEEVQTGVGVVQSGVVALQSDVGTIKTGFADAQAEIAKHLTLCNGDPLGKTVCDMYSTTKTTKSLIDDLVAQSTGQATLDQGVVRAKQFEEKGKQDKLSTLKSTSQLSEDAASELIEAFIKDTCDVIHPTPVDLSLISTAFEKYITMVKGTIVNVAAQNTKINEFVTNYSDLIKADILRIDPTVNFDTELSSNELSKRLYMQWMLPVYSQLADGAIVELFKHMKTQMTTDPSAENKLAQESIVYGTKRMLDEEIAIGNHINMKTFVTSMISQLDHASMTNIPVESKVYVLHGIMSSLFDNNWGLHLNIADSTLYAQPKTPAAYTTDRDIAIMIFDMLSVFPDRTPDHSAKVSLEIAKVFTAWSIDGFKFALTQLREEFYAYANSNPTFINDMPFMTVNEDYQNDGLQTSGFGVGVYPANTDMFRSFMDKLYVRHGESSPHAKAAAKILTLSNMFEDNYAPHNQDEYGSINLQDFGYTVEQQKQFDIGMLNDTFKFGFKHDFEKGLRMLRFIQKYNSDASPDVNYSTIASVLSHTIHYVPHNDQIKLSAQNNYYDSILEIVTGSQKDNEYDYRDWILELANNSIQLRYVMHPSWCFYKNANKTQNIPYRPESTKLIDALTSDLQNIINGMSDGAEKNKLSQSSRHVAQIIVDEMTSDTRDLLWKSTTGDHQNTNPVLLHGMLPYTG